MGAQQPVPGVVRVTLQYQISTVLTNLTRIFIKYTGTAPTAAQMTTFAGAVGAAWGTNLNSLATSAVIENQTTCTDLSSATGATGFDQVAHTGTRAGAGNPAGVCTMIQYSIARRYRGGKPKGFLPFGVQGDLANQQAWTGAFVTAVNTGWTAFINAIIAAGWTGAGTLSHVNVSFFQGFTVVTNPITHRARNVPNPRQPPLVDPVIGYLVEGGVASQRRRNNV